MGLPLPLLNLRRRLAGGISPAALFLNSEPGVWYDPSDLTTMFQDRAGTTLVTTPGQSVGLVLDKRLGLTPGPELVTNGTFDTDVSGWTGRSATLSASDGRLTVTSTASSGRATQNFLVTSGVFYEASVTVIGGTGTRMVRFGVSDGNAAYFNDIGKNTTYSFKFLATSSSFWISLYSGDVVGNTAIFDNISVREIPGNHMVAVSDAARGTYNVDSNGKAFILFDGADDGYLTSTITPGTDKAQVFAGVRKLSDAAAGTLIESSASSGSNLGTFAVFAPKTNGQAGYSFRSQGGTFAQTDATSTLYAAPVTTVVTGLGDIAADGNTLRANSVQVAVSAQDQGTGNYLAYPIYIGRRGGTTLPFNGRLYQLAVRFGPNLDAARITQVERFINSKTGAY
jgi:hypothetical protein